MEDNIKKIPWLPLSALIFYLTAFTLWKLGFIPPPSGILIFLENLYKNYGLLGLFIASFLEGIVYLGLYFPGSFIIALAVLVSDGANLTLLTISLIVALALTITAIINYFLGTRIKTKDKSVEKIASRGLFFSMLHPNTLAFYFFNAGVKKGNLLKIIFVPIVMIPYGFALAKFFYLFKEGTRNAIETPYVMISLIAIWIILGFVFDRKSH